MFVCANDSIKLVFLESNVNCSCSLSAIAKTVPSFTHQIFDDEMIKFGASILDCKVDIFISCYNGQPFCWPVGMNITATLSGTVFIFIFMIIGYERYSNYPSLY